MHACPARRLIAHAGGHSSSNDHDRQEGHGQDQQYQSDRESHRGSPPVLADFLPNPSIEQASAHAATRSLMPML
jgi:hypothetical protein